MTQADVVIVGTGHGGAQAAIALRQLGHEGSILLLGRDSEPPYERPPLSKEYLAGEKPFERLLIRPPQFWADKGIELRLRSTVTDVDAQAHQIVLSDGSRIAYRKLIWAAGGNARRLSCHGGNLPGVFAIRDKRDVDGIIERLDRGARTVAVIGGGYIGLEAAAVLRKLGREVILVEALDRVLARVAGEELSRFFEQEHRAKGVDLRLQQQVAEIEGDDQGVRAVKLASGERVECDLVIVGIGIVPAVGPLIAAGAAGSNGVDVDGFCRTSLDDIFAIGDCAAHANVYADQAVVRLESVQNAHDMAKTAAQAITGDKQPYEALPWFWSNQYDIRLQTAGLSLDYEQTLLRGDPQSRSFTLVYLREGRPIAFDCVNNTKDFVQARKLLESRPGEIDPALLADPQVPLKSLI